MDRIFQIGDFTFRLICPAEVTPPDNFMLFACGADKGIHRIPGYTCDPNSSLRRKENLRHSVRT